MLNCIYLRCDQNLILVSFAVIFRGLSIDTPRWLLDPTLAGQGVDWIALFGVFAQPED